MRNDYSLELIEYALARPAVVDELVADFVDNILDDVDIDIAGGRARHSRKISSESDNRDLQSIVFGFNRKVCRNLRSEIETKPDNGEREEAE